MRMRKKKWVEPFLAGETHYLVRSKQADMSWKSIRDYEKCVLEIGMGMGDFLTKSAHAHPENIYIGFEKDETCVAKAIKKAEELGLDNLYIINDDATHLMEWFMPGEVDVLYLQFSDPWPKKAHAKRRLTYASFLSIYEEVLSDAGTLIFKTDNEGLFEYSLCSFAQSRFVLRELSLDLHRHKEENDVLMTEYERKFSSEGNRIFYAEFGKECHK